MVFVGMDPAPTEGTTTFQGNGRDYKVIPVEDAEISFNGGAGGDWAGYSVSIAGDYNGDGVNDILISAAGNDSFEYNCGMVFLINGSTNISHIGNSFDLQNASSSFHGEFPNDQIGLYDRQVSCAGDVNGDDIDDFLISSYRYDGNRGKTYLFFGRQGGFDKNSNVSSCSASFVGEFPADRSGRIINGAGDVNGDGYDDFLISAPYTSRGSISYQGGVYLIFGKPDGWEKNTSLSKSDVIFTGLTVNSRLGHGSPAGDYNGDGLDDIVMSQGNQGSTYLIFGHNGQWNNTYDLDDANVTITKPSGATCACSGGDLNNDGRDDLLVSNTGFSLNSINNRGKVWIFFGNRTFGGIKINETHSNASYIGYGFRYYLGKNMGGIGDVNQDGYGDIMIGANSAYYNDVRRSGVTYLIYGKENGWGKNLSMSNADVCFHGGYVDHWAGSLSDGPGDVDNDGLLDIIIGACYANTSRGRTGSAYLFKEFNPDGPRSIYSVKLYSDENCTEEITETRMNSRVFIELRGEDGNATTLNIAYARITSMESHIEIKLQETSINSGVYRNSFIISDTTSKEDRTIRSYVGGRVRVFSIKDISKLAYIDIVTSIKLYPFSDRTTAVEDEEYRIKYSNSGVSIVQSWDVVVDSDWLSWDGIGKELFGTPDHGHVGSRSNVMINISDSDGKFDAHEFVVFVDNTPPTIITDDVVTAREDDLYQVDYDSDDDDLADMAWSLDTNASWLSIDAETGILSGTPVNDDVGIFGVLVTTNDGKGGESENEFNLTVSNVNDAPVIVTDPGISTLEDEEYHIGFEVADVDDEGGFIWDVNTDTSWLSMNRTTGVLSGIPDNDDVGLYTVNVSVEDSGGRSGHLEFSLEVMNDNDAPEWSIVPEDSTVDQGDWYTSKIEALDVDIGDEIVYTISSDPVSNITINGTTGEIIWYAYLPDPPYELDVEVSATDGNRHIFSFFAISVIPNLKPTVGLISPEDGRTIVRLDLILEWEGCDKEGCDLTYDIYLAKTREEITSLNVNCKLMGGCPDTSFTPPDLKFGTTYYWSVVPFDDICAGSCPDGIFSFYVNTPPIIGAIPDGEIIAGESFVFTIQGGDNDTEQVSGLTYSLVDGPDGIEVFPDTGKFVWTPLESQAGIHEVTVSIFDGYEYNQISFNIDVKGASSSSEKSIAVPIVVTICAILLLIIIAVIIAMIFSGRREEDDKDQSKDAEPKCTVEKGEDLSDVPVSFDEAYGSLGPHALPTQQELYGREGLDLDEDVSRDDLKESLSDQIKQLEEMEAGAGIGGQQEPQIEREE